MPRGFQSKPRFSPAMFAWPTCRESEQSRISGVWFDRAAEPTTVYMLNYLLISWEEAASEMASIFLILEPLIQNYVFNNKLLCARPICLPCLSVTAEKFGQLYVMHNLLNRRSGPEPPNATEHLNAFHSNRLVKKIFFKTIKMVKEIWKKRIA